MIIMIITFDNFWRLFLSFLLFGFYCFGNFLEDLSQLVNNIVLHIGFNICCGVVNREELSILEEAGKFNIRYV